MTHELTITQRLYQDKEKRHAYWLAKQEWRRGLLTTEM